MILNFIAKNNLTLENKGKTMTFSSPLGTSVIDLTLSRGITVEDWIVSDNDNTSDHKCLSYKIGLSRPNTTVKWAYRKADWKGFTGILEDLSGKWRCPSLWTADTIDKQVKSSKTI